MYYFYDPKKKINIEKTEGNMDSLDDVSRPPEGTSKNSIDNYDTWEN